jgi:hypothetical protein
MRVATLLVFVLMVFSAVAVSAQAPFIAVYFDNTFQTEATINPGGCPGVGTIDTLYIAITNANSFVSGVDFAVNYPPELFFISDMWTQPVTVGTTQNGISMGWGSPQNGFSTVFICGVLVQWMCDTCPSANIPVPVVTNPNTLFLGYTDFPSFNQFPAVGLTSLICATVATEESTWGKVKSLYHD